MCKTWNYHNVSQQEFHHGWSCAERCAEVRDCVHCFSPYTWLGVSTHRCWWSAKSRTITFSFSHGMNLSSKFTHFMNSRLWILVPLSNFLSTHMYTCCSLTLSDHGRRWSFLLRSWRLSAGCVLSPPTTSITLRQKQGGEQETFSRGPLQKKTLSHTAALGEDAVTFKGVHSIQGFLNW